MIVHLSFGVEENAALGVNPDLDSETLREHLAWQIVRGFIAQLGAEGAPPLHFTHKAYLREFIRQHITEMERE